MSRAPDFPPEDSLAAITAPGFPEAAAVALREEAPESPEAAATRRAARRRELADVRAQVSAIRASSLSPTERIEQLIRLQTAAMLPMLGELYEDEPDVNRALVCSKAVTAIRDTVAMVAKKAELDTAEDFNPNSPKFQIAFGWFIDLVHRVLTLNVADETLVHNVFNDLQNELAGFEDILIKRLRGVSGRSVTAFESPFVSDWRTRLGERVAEHKRLIEQGVRLTIQGEAEEP